MPYTPVDLVGTVADKLDLRHLPSFLMINQRGKYLSKKRIILHNSLYFLPVVIIKKKRILKNCSFTFVANNGIIIGILIKVKCQKIHAIYSQNYSFTRLSVTLMKNKWKRNSLDYFIIQVNLCYNGKYTLRNSMMQIYRIR